MRIDNEQFDQFMARLQSQPPTLRDTQATADAIMLRISRKPKRKVYIQHWILVACRSLMMNHSSANSINYWL